MTENNALYDNAIASIRVAVEDFVTGEPTRLSPAVRNLVAGLLLLCKAKLARISPAGSKQVLIWEKLKVIPGGSCGVTVARNSNLTASKDTIKARFEDFEIVCDWDALEKAVKVRNVLEHFYLEGDAHARSREAFGEGYKFLDQFLSKEMGIHPPDALGSKIWMQLVEQHNIEELARTNCRSSFGMIDWGMAPEEADGVLYEMRCANCGSNLLAQSNSSNRDFYNMSLVCKACGREAESNELIEEAVAQHFEGEWHIAAKDGEDDLCQSCDECGMETFVVSSNKCYACGSEGYVPNDAIDD